jgi:hypothetical protein
VRGGGSGDGTLGFCSERGACGVLEGGVSDEGIGEGGAPLWAMRLV